MDFVPIGTNRPECDCNTSRMFSIVAVEVGIKRPGYVFLCEVSSPLLAAKKFTPSVHNPRINSLVKKARRTLRREPQGGMHHWSKACRPPSSNYEHNQTHDVSPEGTGKKRKELEQKEQPSRHLEMVLLVSFPSKLK